MGCRLTDDDTIVGMSDAHAAKLIEILEDISESLRVMSNRESPAADDPELTKTDLTVGLVVMPRAGQQVPPSE